MSDIETTTEQLPPKNICVTGWYNHNNIGDDSFQLVFKNLLPENSNITFTERPDLSADVIILGGGGVVRDSFLTGLENYSGHLYAIGVDISVNGPSWDKIKSLPFKHIYTRSTEYAAIASKEHPNVSYLPDISFCLQYPAPLENTKPRIGLILSNDITKHASVPLHIANTMKLLSDRYPDLVVMPFFTAPESNDPAINATIGTLCGRSFQYISPKTPMEAIYEINTLDFLITMRFHGAIFATITGTPFISISNKGKCSLYCEQERLFEHFIELSECTDVKLMDRINYISSQPNCKEKLISIADKNRQLLQSLNITIPA